MQLNVEFNGKTIMKAMNFTSHNGTDIWYNHKMLCCLSPEENGTRKISIRHLEDNSQENKSRKERLSLPQDDYGMNFEDDVLTEEEREELEEESEEDNAKR